MNRIFRKSFYAFTLVELMIAVAIVAVLTAVAIPAYQSYIRRSYLSEATSSIAAIKAAEESYFTINGCYVEALPNPSTVPAGTQVAWTDATGWGRNALSVRPDRRVRFQYQVYASNSIGCAAPTRLAADLEDTDFIPDACIGTPRVDAGGTLVDTSFFGNNWYVVVIKGDLDGDAELSTIVSAIDDTLIWQCDELE